MAYWNNNQQSNVEPDRTYAIDWEAKSIPRLAYRNCLITKETLLLSNKGSPDHSPILAKNGLIAAVCIFYDTVESGFVKYLESEEYKAKPFKFSATETIGVSDYEQLLSVKAGGILDLKLFLLFKILKNWCFDKGPFQTFSDQDEDVFKRLEHED